MTNIGTGQLAEAQLNGLDQRRNHESRNLQQQAAMRYANIGEKDNAD